MHCRRFRDQHALLIDERCSALLEREMREHMRECPKCARHDASIRRSLLLARNLPDVQLSPSFQARLHDRLRTGAQPLEVKRRADARLVAAVAAAAAMVGFIALGTARGRAPEALRLAPVVATAPEADPSVISTALVATLPTGMSVWPAIVAATHAPVHFVTAEMADER